MRRLNLALALMLLVGFALSLLAGRVWLDFGNMPRAWLILAELRAPRSVLALVVGAGLGASGAVMQGYLRNPLADPGLFGIAPSAALGAVLVLYFGITAPLALPFAALVGAGAAMALLAAIAHKSAGASQGLALFTLAGLMIASLSGTLTSLVISLAPNAFALETIMAWMLGALTDRGWGDVAIAGPLTGIGLAFLFSLGRDLDALILGEAAARSLGMDARSVVLRLVIGIGLVIGSGVAAAGIIGFVGLMVPHVMRPLTDKRPSQLLVPSALAGALLVLVADMIVRVLPLMVELRLGLVMSFLGAPFFLALLLKMRRGVVQ